MELTAHLPQPLSPDVVEGSEPALLHHGVSLVCQDSAGLSFHLFQEALQRRQSRDLCRVGGVLVYDGKPLHELDGIRGRGGGRLLFPRRRGAGGP